MITVVNHISSSDKNTFYVQMLRFKSILKTLLSSKFQENCLVSAATMKLTKCSLYADPQPIVEKRNIFFDRNFNDQKLCNR